MIKTSCQLLDGRAAATAIEKKILSDIEEFKKNSGRPPTLSVVLVGEHAPSQIYVSMKQKAAERVGLGFQLHRLQSNIKEIALTSLIGEINRDPKIDGLIVQLPLPPHLDPRTALNTIHPDKDIDGFHPLNIGRLITSRALLEPCTPKGIMALLAHYGIECIHKHAVVVGRSAVVGRPLSVMLLRASATVTICHRHTVDLGSYTKLADILVVAVGKPHLITGNMVKPGGVVVDVGISRLDNGTIVGDVDFETVSRVASHLSPVPGGVGPMTIAMLLSNTVRAAQHLAHVKILPEWSP
ncbi:MAG: bifunctional methylenetetrahydrofolate dehydrogenase/methenyltetrahydrofolate cyclohydrolase FolD [Deltaproteobacteria bacterium]|nr:bifunctional methylenetetrahydrofolate dehydrogenase/methenyltetrahydrofolate cyclohydrolase FolD [Deltaproteobacteria bacterium]